MTFVAINAIEQNIAMTAANNTAELLEQLRPARNNMAVVEPVAIPILLEPPNIALHPIQTHHESDNMDIDAMIINQSTNEIHEPMMYIDISIEEKELQFPAEFNINWIAQKILFNNSN